MKVSNIDYGRDALLTDQAKDLMFDYYMDKEETSPQEAFSRAALAYCGGDFKLAERMYDYASKQYMMFSSPVLSNAPKYGCAPKGLPISCFLSYVPDTIEGLIGHQAELAWLSVKGGGVGGHWSDIRHIDEKSTGCIPFLKTVDSAITAFKQGKTRKGAYASYLDIGHPSIVEFLNIRKPTGGDVNRKCLNSHHAVNISDAFMEKVISGGDWELRNPKDGEVVDVVSARTLFQDLLETRSKTGEPYLNFIDTVNNQRHEAHKDLGLKIKGSNLCNEIHLPTTEDRTAVCCLSSLNLEKYDEWKDTTIVEDLVTFLDNVLSYFIEHAPPELAKAVNSAEKERSIGIGAMGWHGYLQSKDVPFESPAAIGITRNIFKNISTKAKEQSYKLGLDRGCPEDLLGYGSRNAYLLAIAPNANSSILANCSPSIEPTKSNAYPHRTRAGTHLIKNKYLVELLSGLGKNTEDVWQSIIDNEGSVHHLDFLNEQQKDVFKTWAEIDQMWVIEQAGHRQQFLCQGQSVNLYFNKGVSRSYVLAVHMAAWKKGLKGLYYYRTNSGATADKVGTKIERVSLSSIVEGDDCVACQG